MIDPREFWKIASTFPANKEDVYPDHAEAQEFIQRHVGERVLEYGCGGGSDAMSYLRRGCEVVYADIVPENVFKATQRIAALRLSEKATGCLLLSSDVLHFPDGYFDIVNAHGVLHHIEDPLPVLKAFHRVLRPGGLLYVMLYTEHLFAVYTNDSQPQNPSFGAYTDGEGCYARSYIETEGRALLAAAGFSVDRVFLYNKNHFRTFRATRA